jgi:hypothetical protein
MKLLERLGLHARQIEVGVTLETLAFQEQSLRIALPAATSRDTRQLQGPIRKIAPLLPGAPLPLFPVARGVESEGVTAMRYAALVSALHDGIAAILKDRIVKRRPHLTIGGAANLEPSLHGYQYELLRRAAFDAGALTVTFLDPTGNLPSLIVERQQDPRTLRNGV